MRVKFFHNLRVASITVREAQVLELLSHGLENKEIAFELGITLSTVKSHIAEMMAKGHFVNRTQLSRWASADKSVFERGHVVEVAA